MNNRTRVVILAPHALTGMGIKRVIEKSDSNLVYGGCTDSLSELAKLGANVHELIVVYDAMYYDANYKSQLQNTFDRTVNIVYILLVDNSYHREPAKSELLLNRPYTGAMLMEALGKANRRLNKQREENIILSKGDDKISQAIQYINNNLDQTLTLESIAAQVYISPGYLSRLFKNVVGQTINDYVSDLRLQYVKDHLAGTDESIKNIAMSAGYDKINSFNQFFRRNTGMSPSEYREDSKNKDKK